MSSRVLRVNIVGPDAEELLKGSFMVASAFPTAVASKPTETAADMPMPPAKDGYHMHPYVGIPGIIGVGGARHFCAFPSGISARPARVEGQLLAGSLFDDLSFSMEGVLHLSDVQIMKLPPWGHLRPVLSKQASVAHGQASPARAAAAADAAAPAVDNPSDEINWRVDYVDDFGNGTSTPTVPWQVGGAAASRAPASSNPAALISDLLDASNGAVTHDPKSSRTVQRRSLASAAPVESKTDNFPWHLHDL
jgi:hypothetical protein